MTEPSLHSRLPTDDDGYRRIMTAIIQRFIRLVGAPAALNVAQRIHQLSVDAEGNVLDYNRVDPLDTITQLIDQFGSVFGNVALTLAQQATQPIIGHSDNGILPVAALFLSEVPSPMRLLLVDDHALFREGLVSLLTPQPDMRVVGQANSVQEAVTLARELKPDLILMDIALPDGSGIEAARIILTEAPLTKIMFLTVYDDDEQLFASIRVGAVGYIFKNARSSELLKSIRSIARGEAAISRPIAHRILQEFSRLPSPAAPNTLEPTELTNREIEIVREMTLGASNREIAQKLVISENTVKNHIRNVLSKLRLRSRREVANYARTHGLTSPRSNDLP